MYTYGNPITEARAIVKDAWLSLAAEVRETETENGVWAVGLLGDTLKYLQGEDLTGEECSPHFFGEMEKSSSEVAPVQDFQEHTLVVRFEPFNNNYVTAFFSSDCKKTWENHRKEYGSEGKWPNAQAVCFEYGEKCCIVFSLDATFEAIAHESFHAVMSLMNKISADRLTAEGECGAHCLGYLVKKISAFQEGGFKHDNG